MPETRTANRNAHRRISFGGRKLPENRPWQLEQVQTYFPQHTRKQVEQALADCQVGTEDRGKVLDCMNMKLSMKDVQ